MAKSLEAGADPSSLAQSGQTKLCAGEVAECKRAQQEGTRHQLRMKEEVGAHLSQMPVLEALYLEPRARQA